MATPSASNIMAQAPSSSRVTSLGLRYPSNKKTIYNRNLHRARNGELSRAAFAFLFIEMINYAQRQVKGITDLEKRLNAHGYPLGVRMLDLLLTRTTPQPSVHRPTRLLSLLQFITTNLWKALFSRPADALERSANSLAEYMISDNEPLVNQFVSVPREMNQLNTAAFLAGIIEGLCDAAGFKTMSVSAHWASEGGGAGASDGGSKGEMWPGKTVFLIKFAPEVLEREELLGKPS